MKNKLITCNGKSQTVSTWSRDERCTVSGNAITSRLRSGWLPEDAIFTPAQSVSDIMKKRGIKLKYGDELLTVSEISKRTGKWPANIRKSAEMGLDLRDINKPIKRVLRGRRTSEIDNISLEDQTLINLIKSLKEMGFRGRKLQAEAVKRVRF